jgi:hypothetical protein
LVKLSKIAVVSAVVLALGLSTSGRIKNVEARATITPTYTTVSGIFKISFVITLASSVPTTDVIVCKLSAVPEYDSISDAATAPATRIGSTATCTVTLPYKWTLPATTTPGEISLVYDIGDNLASIGYPQETILRETSAQVFDPPITVPTNGTVTTKSVAVTF